MWSVGCIFYEFITQNAMLQGKSEFEQLDKMFRLLGTPKVEHWPGVLELPHVKKFHFFAKTHQYVSAAYRSSSTSDVSD